MRFNGEEVVKPNFNHIPSGGNVVTENTDPRRVMAYRRRVELGKDIFDPPLTEQELSQFDSKDLL